MARKDLSAHLAFLEGGRKVIQENQAHLVRQDTVVLRDSQDQ